MPENLDYALYFNIAFFGVIGLGFLGGYFRGLKKTTWKLVVLLLFYAFFFLSVDIVVDQLWVTPMPQILSMAAPYVPEIGNASTIGDAVFSVVESAAGDTIGDTMSNAVFIDFVTGLSLFVVKIIYAILYFTIGQVIFRFVFYLIRVLFFNGPGKRVVLDGDGNKKKLSKRQYKKWLKEEKKREKDRKKAYKKMSRKQKKVYKKEQKALKKKREKLEKKQKQKQKKPVFGAFVGAAKGTVTAFVSLILLGGFLNISESFLVLLPEEQTQTAQYVEQILLSTDTEPMYFESMDTIPERTALVEIPSDMQSNVTEVRNLIHGYNNNEFVKNATKLKVTDENYNSNIALNLYLFDTVFSFNIGEEKVLLRNELDVVAESANVVFNSEFSNSNDLSDITGEEVRTIFVTMSESTLITELIPLGIDVGSSYLDIPLEVPKEELYEIEWDAELQTLGAIASTAFDLVNNAGIIGSDDLTTVTLDGSEVESIFNRLSESELATLGAYVAVEPLLEQAGGTINAIITVPEGMEWDKEFIAFGEVAKAILDTGITIGQLEQGDPNVLINALSGMDFTILLNSTIVSHALRNIFDGSAGLQGLDMIVIPANVSWFDTYDSDGDLVAAGELRNILAAVNSITDVASDFDFDNINLNVIADFDDATIDDMFNSEVLVATISDYLLNADLGDTPLIIPDSVLDENNYLLASELKAVAKSAKVLVTDLACDDGDTECENTGFDIAKAFDLDDTAIDTLTTSDILGATIGNLIIDNGGNILVIPPSALMSISVDDVLLDVVSKQEIKRVFQAVGTLGFTDLDNMTFDASIISNLETTEGSGVLDTTKSAKLFNSILVHATLSDMLIEQATGDSAVLTVPYFAQNNDVIRSEDGDDSTIEYISTTELDNLLQSLITLDISDFANVDSLDIGNVIADADTLLESSILQATISTQVFDLGTEVINVPYQDVDANDVRISVGDSGEGTDTEYIDKEEIKAILDSLEILNITDINTFDGTVDIAEITSDPANITTMLTSATLHATISDQLIQLDTDDVISVPYFEQDDITLVRLSIGPVGNEQEFIQKDEISAMIDALNILEITDVDSFDGNVDLSKIYDPDNTEGAIDNRSLFLESSTIQATVSKQVFDLGTETIKVPFQDIDTNEIRVTVGDSGQGTDTEYIIKLEIEAIIESLDILGILDVNDFDGSVNIADITSDPANITTMLTSATLHATISDQLLDLDTDDIISVPYLKADDTTLLRETVGPVGNEQEFIQKDEISAMIDALNILEITDVESFSGSVDLSLLTTGDNASTVLESSTIQATVSEQIYDLTSNPSMAATFVVPYYNQADDTLIRISVGDALAGTDTDYILASEIEAMIDGLDILGITDVETFDGSIDLTPFYDSTQRDTLLLSSIMQATISTQLIDLGDNALRIPLQDITTTPVRVTVGDALDGTDTEYVTKNEIGAMFEALEVLGITDVNSFTGTIDLNNVFGTTNQNIILDSASMHATITKQLVDLGSATLTIPDTDVTGTSIQQTVATTLFIEKFEIKAMINGLEVLGITDINSFDGTVNLTNLYDGTNQDIILSSASMHATITKQLVDLGSATLTIPDQDIDTNLIKTTVSSTLFVVKDEIKAMINALEVLGINDINGFDGTVDLTNLYDGTNQDIILSSASMHATITKQMTDLGTNVLYIPDNDVTGTSIQQTVASTLFVEKFEIKALINSLEVLSATDIATFDGTFDFNTLSTETNQDTLLTSASIHATITNELLDLNDEVLIVPLYTQTGETAGNEIQLSVGTFTFVIKDEIKSLINAFTTMGYTNLNSFGASIDSSEFFSGRDTLLLSSSIQATLSNKLINGTGGELIVPDTNVNTSDDIRLVHTDVTYVKLNEIEALLDGLEALGLDDFTSLTFDPVTVFAADFDTVLTSASLQATISSKILPSAGLETAAVGTTTLLVPTEFRDNITVDSVGEKHIEKVELKKLLESLEVLGVSDFNGGMNASVITNMTDTELDTLLNSASIHTTVDNMLRGNAALSFPELAEVNPDPSYKANIITRTEIKLFIKATTTVTSTSSFTDVTFSPAAIAALTPTEQGVVADSMIVRDTLTPTIEALVTVDPLYSFTATDYMNDDTNTFLKKTPLLDAVNNYY